MIPIRLFCIRVLCSVLTITICSGAAAQLVVDIDQESAKQFQATSDQLQRINSAKKALFQDGLDKCREILDQARATSPDMPHADVTATGWYFEAGQPAKAVLVMERLAVAEPDRPDVRLLFATVALEQGRLFDAWTHSTAAVKSNMPDAWSEKFRQQVRNDIARTRAVTAARRADWESAKSIYEHLTEKTGDTDARLGLATAEFFLGEMASAEAHIRKACEPSSVKAIPELILATLSEQNQKLKECEHWFRTGVELKQPASTTVRLEYARWLLRHNRPVDAKPGKPSDDQAADYDYVNGLADRMAGEFAAAEARFAKLHQADPANFPISNQLALVLIENTDEGKRGRAHQIATANARRFPKSADALSTLGWIQYRLGDPLEAEKFLTASISGGQATRDTAYYLSKVKSALGKTQEATRFANASRDGTGEFFSRSKELDVSN